MRISISTSANRATSSSRAGAVLFVLVGLVGSVLVGPAAFATIDECAVGRTCLWDNAGYDSYIGSRPPGGGISNVSATAADRTSSWANRSDTDAAWYPDVNGGGTCRNMPSHTRDPELTLFVRDTLSSWKANGSC